MESFAAAPWFFAALVHHRPKSMSEFHNDSIIPPKHGVLSPFAMLVWAVLIVAVLGLGSLFLFHFDFGRLRGSAYFMDQANQAMARKDWPAALHAIQHVTGLHREKPAFLRLVVDYLEATRTDPATLDDFLRKLESLGLMKPEDLIWACRLRLAEGNLGRAREALERIPAAQLATADGFKLKIAILKEEGRRQEAADEERQLFEKFPNDPEIALFKAIKELDGTFPEITKGAVESLMKIARGDDPTALSAIRALSRRRDLSLPEANLLRQAADSHPGLMPAERLTVTSLIMRLDPRQRETLLKEEVKRYAKADNNVLAQLVMWLAGEKEYDRVLSLLAPDPLAPKAVLTKVPELFPVVVQCFAAQERWEEVISMLKKGKPLPVADSRAATWRALATKNLYRDRDREVRTHLEEAIHSGGAEKSQLAVLGAAKLAETWSMPDLALKAYEALAQPGTSQELPMLEKCWETAAQLRDSTVMLRVTEKLIRLKPTSTQLAMRRDYLRLLRGEAVETTLGSAEDSPVRPGGDSARLLLALKAYRMQDPPQAVAALREIRDHSLLSVGERAVYAGLLVGAGEISRAYQIAEKISDNLLLNEEAAFLHRAL